MKMYDDIEVVCDNNIFIHKMAQGICATLQALGLDVKFSHLAHKTEIDRFFLSAHSKTSPLVICMHGVHTEGKYGFRFECMARSGQTGDFGPFTYDITQDMLPDLWKIKHELVISTACSSGRSEVSDILLTKGVNRYIAPTVDISIMSSMLFVQTFFYNLMYWNPTDIEACFEKSRRIDDSPRNGDTMNYQMRRSGV